MKAVLYFYALCFSILAANAFAGEALEEGHSRELNLAARVIREITHPSVDSSLDDVPEAIASDLLSPSEEFQPAEESWGMFVGIPIEARLPILSSLSFLDLVRLSQTSKTWRNLMFSSETFKQVCNADSQLSSNEKQLFISLFLGRQGKKQPPKKGKKMPKEYVNLLFLLQSFDLDRPLKSKLNQQMSVGNGIGTVGFLLATLFTRSLLTSEKEGSSPHLSSLDIAALRNISPSLEEPLMKVLVFTGRVDPTFCPALRQIRQLEYTLPCSNPPSLAPLKYLPRLTGLKVNAHQSIHLELQDFPTLKTLTFSSPLKGSNKLTLAHMPALKTVRMDSARVKKLTLEGLPSLMTLIAPDNLFAKLPPLTTVGAPHLKILDLKRNRLKGTLDVRAAEGLEVLETAGNRKLKKIILSPTTSHTIQITKDPDCQVSKEASSKQS